MKKYRLKVTAGTEYDPTTHQSVPVNGDQTVVIDNELATVSLSVRIQDYSGIYFIPLLPIRMVCNSWYDGIC